jgi:diguanylate cyclase (GGDEF)-like protein
MQHSWRHVALRTPVALLVGLVVVVSVGLSLLALVTLTAALGLGFDGHFLRYAAIAIAIPALVATPVSWIIVKLLHEADAARRAAQHLAWKDELTGLLNRRRFIELAQRDLERARRSNLHIAVALMDLDRFKLVNDRHGHAAGDAVLRAVANALMRALRSTDLLGRWGGEEFALVLPCKSGAHALEMIERLVAPLRALRIDVGDGVSLQCTASIGLALISRHDERLEDLVRRADTAMYAAKGAGRDRVQLAPPPVP